MELKKKRPKKCRIPGEWYSMINDYCNPYEGCRTDRSICKSKIKRKLLKSQNYK